MLFPKEFFENFNFEKNQQTTKNHEKLPSMQELFTLSPQFLIYMKAIPGMMPGKF